MLLPCHEKVRQSYSLLQAAWHALQFPASAFTVSGTSFTSNQRQGALATAQALVLLYEFRLPPSQDQS